jgi:3-phenylpropionate/trans-cinnamate dioxygenase ferredoxin subunit
MALVKACDKSEVPAGSVKFVSAGGKDLAISNFNGALYAIENWCTHEQGNLSEGQLNKDVLTCPDHGAQFDVKTGTVLGGPDGEPPDTIPRQKNYTVKVQGNDVMVEIP